MYTSQIRYAQEAQAAQVRIPDAGEETYPGTIEAINPEVYPAAQINLLRITIPNPAGKLRPGMAAYVTLVSPPA